MKHIISFSGGKDSTAMLLMMLENQMPVDYIVFCDTGKEFPAMYEHIKQVNEYVKRCDKEIIILKAAKSFDYWFSEHIKTKGKNKGCKGYGWATMGIRWCTSVLKQQVMRKFLKSINEPYVEYIGIAYDEPKRIKCDGKRYPLYEMQITEQQALEYCYSKGFTWNGLYNDFKRVSCWCCPLKSIPELRMIYRKYPELWSELKDMDAKSINKFRADYSINDLEEKFKKELQDAVIRPSN